MIGTIARGVTGFRPEASPSATPAPRRRASHRRAMALWLAFAASVPVAGAAVASPALEYGPGAEARFLQRCEDSSGMDPAGCRRLNERLQSALGYEAYFAHADGGPEAFASPPAAASSPTPCAATSPAATPGLPLSPTADRTRLP
jgi:hypothetical protein